MSDIYPNSKLKAPNNYKNFLNRDLATPSILDLGKSDYYPLANDLTAKKLENKR